MPDVRLFTIAEAEGALPLVRRILLDLQAEYPVWRAAVAAYEVVAGAARADWGETPQLLATREAVTASAEKINVWLRELDQVGCVFKGFEPPLVDFYALRDDRPVFLCWHLGEERITHWHEIDAGYAGRQPIEPELLASRGH
ncbi:MAG: DUF2203 domain-containing protein [Gemmatimonadales bacterium]